MNEYKVMLVNGYSIVYADRWVIINRVVHFKTKSLFNRYRTTSQFPLERVISIQKIWPEEEKIWVNKLNEGSK